jgi:hypothetical protein
MADDAEGLALYRQNVARGWRGDHFLQRLQELAADDSKPRLQKAATKAINSFLAKENNVERLVRGDATLSKDFAEYAKAGRINSPSFDLSGWDALEEYSDEVTKYKIGTWAYVDPVNNFLPNGAVATMQAFLDFVKKK